MWKHLLIILLVLISASKATESANISLPGCPDSCGGVAIPYPFGLGPNCSFSKDFELSCRTSDPNGTFTPYMPGHFNLTSWFPIVNTSNFDLISREDIAINNIDLSLGQARISSPVSFQCYNSTTKKSDRVDWEISLLDSSYKFNHEKNMFVTIGCDTLGFVKFSIAKDAPWGSCGSWCYDLGTLTNGSCSGIGCCQTAIPKGTDYIWAEFETTYDSSKVYNFSRCSYAMLTEEVAFTFDTSYITTSKLSDQNMTAVIDWAIGNTTCDNAQADKSSYACKSDHSACLNSSSGPGYLCNCQSGYQGNPYLQGGCQGVCVSLSELTS